MDFIVSVLWAVVVIIVTTALVWFRRLREHTAGESTESEKIRIDPLQKPENDKRHKVALLIGITKYRTYVEGEWEYSNNLHGPVNDVAAMRTLLLEYGFAAENIFALTSEGGVDRQPTRKNVLQALDDLSLRCTIGSVVYFFYAGHGSRIHYSDWENDAYAKLILAEKPPREQLNRWVDTIVPCDDRHDMDPDLKNRIKITQITDCELQQKFSKIAEKTTNITIIFDCCHSEHLMRRSKEANQRSKPTFEHGLTRPQTASRTLVRGVFHNPASNMPSLASEKAYVMFAACCQDQSAWEGRFISDGKYHGYWSKAFISAIESVKVSHNNYFSNAELFDSACVALSLFAKDVQQPTIEGARGRSFLGLDDMRSDSVGVVMEEETNTETGMIKVKLQTGDFDGAVVGGVYALCAHGTRQYDAKMEVARARILHTGVRTSTAIISFAVTGDAIEHDPPSLLGLRVFDLKQGQSRVRPIVGVDVVLPDLESFSGNKDLHDRVRMLCEKVGEYVSASPLLTNVAGDHDYKVFVRVVDKNSAISITKALPEANKLTDGQVAVLDESIIQEPCFVVLDAKGQKETVKQLGATQLGFSELKLTLDAIGRFHRGMSAGCRLERRSSVLNPLFDKVAMTIEVKPQNGSSYVKLDDISDRFVYKGDQMRATIENKSIRDVHIGLLEFAEDGQVHMLLPACPKSDCLPAGSKPVVLGEDDLNPISFNMATCVRPIATWKLFASTSPIDFSSLIVGEAQRTGKRTTFDDNDSLQSILGITTALRENTRKISNANEHWTTVQQSFQLGLSRANEGDTMDNILDERSEEQT